MVYRPSGPDYVRGGAFDSSFPPHDFSHFATLSCHRLPGIKLGDSRLKFPDLPFHRFDKGDDGVRPEE